MKNVKLDFTKNAAQNNQDVAVMPVEIAKTALRALARSLSIASKQQIISDHMDNLRMISGDSSKSVDDAVQCALDFVNIRSLVTNIDSEKWDAYNVEIEREVYQDIDELGDSYLHPVEVGRIELND